jgi:uridylate kinase
MADTPVFKRALLKLSGEALMGQKSFGLDEQVLGGIADEIAEVCRLGLQLSIVIGGGNIIRGLAASHRGIDRVTGDYMGMLGTVINALALQDALERRDVITRVQTAIEIREVAERFVRRRAMRHLEKGRVVIFAAGTGNPFFTTDSAAALRSSEIKAEALLKATSVDGIYDADPKKEPTAELLREISYQQVLARNLKFMDAAAISLCRENNIPIHLFNLKIPGNILRVVLGEEVGSVVRG